jgi:hypothetical protein
MFLDLQPKYSGFDDELDKGEETLQKFGPFQEPVRVQGAILHDEHHERLEVGEALVGRRLIVRLLPLVDGEGNVQLHRGEEVGGETDLVLQRDDEGHAPSWHDDHIALLHIHLVAAEVQPNQLSEKRRSKPIKLNIYV